MLKKLLKYEFIATGRIFLPLYGALLIVAFIQRLFLNLNFENIENISLGILASSVPMLFLILLVAVFVTSFIMMIIRFYKNLLTSEGYLMFTLPVSVSKLIWSKLIVIVIWMILSVIVGVIACLILVMSISDLPDLFTVTNRLFVEIGANEFWGLFLELALLVLSSLVAGILSVYLSMAVGQLSDKHKLLCSVGAYIGLNIIVNNIILAVIVAVLNSPFGVSMAYGLFATFTENQMAVAVLAGMIALNVVMGAVYFLLTRYILTKKLNLA